MSRHAARGARAKPARAPAPAPPAPAAASEPAGALARLAPLGALALLALATLGAFWGVTRNGFILLDDPTYVTENPHVNAGWTWDGFRWFLHAPHGGNWHPLTSWSHMLDVQLFGLNAGAHHAVSLALHVINVVLLVLVLSRLTGDRWRSLLVGALFGLHPLRVESVAWVAERKDVLSTLFFLLTIEAYRRWVARPGAGRYAATVAALALGLMSKPMLVSTPLVLMLLDVWPLRRWTGLPPSRGARATGAAPARSLVGLALEKWPLFAMAVASAIVTLVVQRASGAVVSTGSVPIGHRVVNAAVTYWRYLGKTVWPTHLIPYYPDTPLAAGVGFAAVAGLVAVTAAVVLLARRRPHLATGWLWYVITLLPVIGLVQVGGQAYADRYTYIPSIGLLVALAWIRLPRRAAPVVAAAAVIVSAALFALTRRQVALWKDTRTLFTAALRVSPDNAIAHNCIGLVLVGEKQYGAAIPEFEAAIDAQPGYLEPYVSLGSALHEVGRNADAIRFYEFVRKVRPDLDGVTTHEGLAMLGVGRVDEAMTLYRGALAMNPDDVEALRQLGIVLAIRRQFAEALPLLRRAEALAPHNAYVQLALAKAIFMNGAPASEVADHMRRAIAAKPDWPDAYESLALLLSSSPDSTVRNPGEAVRLGARAVALTGAKDANALTIQASALAAAGHYDAAAGAARQALAIADSANADSLAASLRAQIRTYEARGTRR